MLTWEKSVASARSVFFESEAVKQGFGINTVSKVNRYTLGLLFSAVLNASAQPRYQSLPAKELHYPGLQVISKTKRNHLSHQFK